MSIRSMSMVLALTLSACSNSNSDSSDGGASDAAIMDAAQDAPPAAPRDASLRDAARDGSHAPTCTTGCDIVEVRAGSYHTCARRENGEVLCWGSNHFKQLGDGSASHQSCDPLFGSPVATDCSGTAQRVSGLSDATHLFVHGGAASCAIRSGGELYCWGMDVTPRPGRDNEELATPGHFADFDNVSSFDVQTFHACSVNAAHEVVCLGDNGSGQLGDGTVETRTAAITVPNVADATQVVVGGSFSCALKSDGTIACWGSNSGGQLGDNMSHRFCGPTARQYDCSTSAVSVANLTDVTQIAAGNSHMCALKSDGTVWCWGSNARGELGINSTSDARTPTEVTGLPVIAEIEAGGGQTCARTSSGALYCWGANRRGQIGDGDDHGQVCTLADETGDCVLTPVQISGVTNVAQMSVGAAHACALTATHELYCWGYNVTYQLGISPNVDLSTPTRVTL